MPSNYPSLTQTNITTNHINHITDLDFYLSHHIIPIPNFISVKK